MNHKSVKQLQYFVGKVCTVLVPPNNRNFDETRCREHFVIRVQSIDEEGIWGSHPYNNTISYFRLEAINSIHEEVELDPANPEHLRMMTEYEQQTGKKIVSDVSPHLTPVLDKPPPKSFVDIKQLEGLAKDSKKIHQQLQ